MADTTLGDVRTDDYSWLRDRKNPETIAYLEAENAYTKARMAHTEGLQEALYQELLGRIKETDLSVPAFKDGYFYYTRTVKGLQYPIHCRKKGNLEAPEEVLLDENLDAGKDAHYAIGAFEVSPNHKLLAYTTDRSGAERYTLVVKNLETGQVLPDHIGNLAEDVHWANDNITLFYDVADSANRPYRLYRHKLGTDPSKDDLVLEETDPLYNLGLSRSRSGSYLFVTMDAFGSTEVHYLSADAPDGKFQVIRPRAKGLEYGVDHSGGFFYIRTNDGGATNFKVSRAPVTDPSRWEPFIEYRPDALVDRILAFKGHLVVAERKDALRQLHVYDLNTRAEHFVPFEESVFSVSPSVNPEFNTGLLRFEYTSLVTPRSVYDYCFVSASMGQVQGLN